MMYMNIRVEQNARICQKANVRALMLRSANIIKSLPTKVALVRFKYKMARARAAVTKSINMQDMVRIYARYGT